MIPPENRPPATLSQGGVIFQGGFFRVECTFAPQAKKIQGGRFNVESAFARQAKKMQGGVFMVEVTLVEYSRIKDFRRNCFSGIN